MQLSCMSVYDHASLYNIYLLLVPPSSYIILRYPKVSHGTLSSRHVSLDIQFQRLPNTVMRRRVRLRCNDTSRYQQ